MAIKVDYQRLEFDAAAQGLNAHLLARKAKVSVPAVINFFRGRCTPPMTKKLARALGYTSMRYLIREEARTA